MENNKTDLALPADGHADRMTAVPSGAPDLPPLPEPVSIGWKGASMTQMAYGYRASHMTAYAKAAIASVGAPASPASVPVASHILPWEKRYMAGKFTTHRAAMLEEIAALRAALAAPVAPVASDERAQETDRRKRLTFTLSQCIHNMVVAEQSAWIEWKHGKGAEVAMEWIENGLMGPGHLPEHDGLTAQEYFNANVDERMEPPAAAPLPPAATSARELTDAQIDAAMLEVGIFAVKPLMHRFARAIERHLQGGAK